jgi:TPR repeat protein
MVLYAQQWNSPLMTTSHGTPVRGAGAAPGARTSRRWFAFTVAGLVVAVAALLGQGAPARADFQAGIDAYARQDYQTALNEWLPYAAQEKPSALFNIGQMYRLGNGVERDLVKAEQYYRRAAELGHIGAMANLGSMMFERKPPRGDEAVMFWRQAARGGDAKSQHLVGIQYFNGELVAQDYAQAYAWLSLAARAGVSGAAEALATVRSNMDSQAVEAASRLAGTLLAPAVAETAADMAAQQDSAVLRHPVDDLLASELIPISPDAVQGAILLPTLEGDAPAPEPQQPVAAARAEPGPTRGVEYRAQFATFSSEGEASALKAALLARHAKLIGKAGVEVEALQFGGVETARYRVRSGLLADEAAAKAICAGVERGGGACQPAKRIRIPVTVKADMDTEPVPSRAVKAAALPVASPVAVQSAPRTVAAVPVPPQPVAARQPPVDPPLAAESPDASGPWRVQVAAGRTEEEARFRWSRLMGTHADLLDAAELFIFKADLGDKGVFYRVQIGGFETRPSAVKFCQKLKARKVECFVTETPQ